MYMCIVIHLHYNNSPLKTLLLLSKDEFDSVEVIVSVIIHAMLADITINTHTFTTRNNDFPINRLLATYQLKIYRLFDDSKKLLCLACTLALRRGG